MLFFFQAEDGIRDHCVTGVQTCALLISSRRRHTRSLCDWSSDVCSLNSASDGGAIFNDGTSSGSATLSITNSTFSQNSASQFGGGIYNDGSSNGIATLNIGDTILKTGTSGENIFNDSGAVTSLGYNLSNDATGGDGTTGPGGLLNATGDQRNTDPLLDPAGLQNNGGPTPTIGLTPGSPAIDAGDPNFDPSVFTPPLTTDQRGAGFDRVSKGKAASATAIVDIGAFEVQGGTFADGVEANGVMVDVADAPLDLTGATIGARPAGGTFRGAGVKGGVFHGETLDPGTYTITYSLTDAQGNMESGSFTITITAANPYLRVIATSVPGGHGIDVPGEPAGTKFTKLGIASMDAGSVGARVSIKPAGGTEIPAIFTGNAFTASGPILNGLTKSVRRRLQGIVVRAGDPAPGA